jgi:putative redox protein
MKQDTIQLEFANTFVGSAESPSGRVVIGQQPDGLAPYHLLFSALGSCFYATFLSVANKKKLTFDRANITVNGVKRDATPATLETVIMDFVIVGGTDEEGLMRSAELGAKYCSIHETISKVATITLNVRFERA